MAGLINKTRERQSMRQSILRREWVSAFFETRCNTYVDVAVLVEDVRKCLVPLKPMGLAERDPGPAHQGTPTSSVDPSGTEPLGSIVVIATSSLRRAVARQP